MSVAERWVDEPKDVPVDTLQPLVGDPRWTRARDAHTKLLIQRLGPREGGDPASLGEALADLETREATRDHLLAALVTMGSDLGRLVLSRRLVEDDVEATVGVLDEALAELGLGGASLEDAFHREAHLRTRSAGWTGDPEVARSFVTGVLHGLFTAAFNADVSVHVRPGDRYRVERVLGRDINREVPRDG